MWIELCLYVSNFEWKHRFNVGAVEYESEKGKVLVENASYDGNDVVVYV